MSYARFTDLMAGINDILCTVNLLAWDTRTQMPPGGADSRGHQVATLTALARTQATGTAMADAIAAAEDACAHLPATDLRRRALARARREIAILSRIPAALIAESAELTSRAHGAWTAARAANDFAAYAPVLERVFALQREMAEAIGYQDHPYDALVGRFEPGMTRARLTALFADLRGALRPLLSQALAAPAPRTDFLSRGYPVPAQKAFAAKMAAALGYDFHRGRVDDTAHPFEISFTRNDVRITGRFRESSPSAGFFALWHEAGHAMYEQNIAPDFTRGIFATDLVNLYAVGGTSFGMHESQSRLWENRVGRSRRFWELHYGSLRDTFPEQLADVSADDFWRAVNRPEPGLIRVEADELTYDFHVFLRAEIEAALIGGDIAVRDLPAIWNDRMREDLGVTVPNDAQGVLQDVHWSHGYVGSFPTYTFGNIMAAQLFDRARQEPAIAAGLQAGDYAPLGRWLTDTVHRHGRSRDPDEILLAATGRGLDPAPYVATLAAKVAELA